MAPGDTARLYHELTSYTPEREWDAPVDDPLVLQDFAPNDLSTFPAAHKAYAEGLPRVELPRQWPSPGVSATEALAGLVPSSGALDLDALARILFLSAGVVRVTERPDGRRYLMRAAGSAGGRFPLELYVSARGVPGLADGVHWYHPADHALVLVGPPAGGDATTVIATGVPWYTGWRYAERGFRHIYWDGGTMLSQTLLLAESAGLRPRLYTRFPDGEAARLVGADGVHEFPIWLVALGDGAPAIRPGGAATPGTVDRDPLEFPLVTHAQRAGDQDALGEPWPDSAPLGSAPGAKDLDEVL